MSRRLHILLFLNNLSNYHIALIFCTFLLPLPQSFPYCLPKVGVLMATGDTENK